MLNGYSDHIKDDHRRAVNAKKYLISMTGTIARKQFQDANNLIESYNRTRAEFSRASRRPPEVPCSHVSHSSSTNTPRSP